MVPRAGVLGVPDGCCTRRVRVTDASGDVTMSLVNGDAGWVRPGEAPWRDDDTTCGDCAPRERAGDGAAAAGVAGAGKRGGGRRLSA